MQSCAESRQAGLSQDNYFSIEGASTERNLAADDIKCSDLCIGHRSFSELIMEERPDHRINRRTCRAHCSPAQQCFLHVSQLARDGGAAYVGGIAVDFNPVNLMYGEGYPGEGS